METPSIAFLSKSAGIECRATVSASAGNPGQTVPRPASADSSSSRQASSARALSAAAAGSSARSSVCRRNAYSAHIDRRLAPGSSKKRIVEVPGLSPRQNAAESVAGLECPIHLHGEFSAGDVPVATSNGLRRARPIRRRRARTATELGHRHGQRSRGPASEAWSTASRPAGCSGRQTRVPRSGRGWPNRRGKTGRRRRPTRPGMRGTRARPSATRDREPARPRTASARRTRA